MRGENYFLVLVTKDDNLFKVHKEPLSLLDIDRRTVLYSGKKELVETILSNNKILIKKSEIKTVYMSDGKAAITSIIVGNREFDVNESYKKVRGMLVPSDSI